MISASTKIFRWSTPRGYLL